MRYLLLFLTFSFLHAKEPFTAFYSDLTPELFEEIYEAGFPMEDLSSFSSRTKRNKPNEFSLHSYGVAIDISPYQNPYYRDGHVLPIGSELYLDRRCNHSGLISEEDACYQAFAKRGWTWGGHWESLKDYMHFEKDFASKIEGNGISWE